MIRFLGLVAVYIVIGSAFRYFVKQERGVRILPHVDFWRAFVIYVLVSTLIDILIKLVWSDRLLDLVKRDIFEYCTVTAVVLSSQEGCRFFLDCITCFKFDGSTRNVKYDSI